MNRTFFRIILLMLYGVNTIGQELPEKENDTIIVWTKERKLKWDDFQHAVFEGTKAAQSDIGISIVSIPTDNRGYKHIVFTYFYKELSSTATAKTEVLKHEQIHFDIAELFARKMRSKFEQLNKERFNRTKFDFTIDRIYKQYFLYQQRYDDETKHSILREEQKRWEEKIEREMREMDRFESKIYK